MAAAVPKPNDKNDLRLPAPKQKSEARALAEVGIDPAAHAASTVQRFSKGTFGELPMTEGYAALHDEILKVRKGNMSGPEATLVAQAAALNAIFTEMARRSALNMGEYIKASESYMRLALKAQAQCRATIETLAAIKNPPVVFARQANISNGPQQVNNHAPPSRAEETTTAPNEQLETEDGKRLDGGAAGAAIGRDTALETVGEGNWPGHDGGEGKREPERLQRRETRRPASRDGALAGIASGH
jgi:hypothetical protein